MGFLRWLNPLNWFRRSKKGAAAAPTPPEPAAEPHDLRPQCAALTAAGDQCRRSARQGSKYCGSHKNYRPPTAMDAMGAKDTLPAVAGARDTAPSTRKGSAKKAAKKAPAKKTAKKAAKTTKKAPAKRASGQVTEGDYRLYKSGNRYFFSKKTQTEAKASGATPVRTMPAGRKVVKTPNGLPVLKKV